MINYFMIDVISMLLGSLMNDAKLRGLVVLVAQSGEYVSQ